MYLPKTSMCKVSEFCSVHSMSEKGNLSKCLNFRTNLRINQNVETWVKRENSQNVEIQGLNSESIKMLKFECKMSRRSKTLKFEWRNSNRSKCWNLSQSCELIWMLTFDWKGVCILVKFYRNFIFSSCWLQAIFAPTSLFQNRKNLNFR